MPATASPVLLTGATVARMTTPLSELGTTGDPFAVVHDAAVALVAGSVAWVGPAAEVPTELADLEDVETEGRLVTPGLVECHTHLLFAGDRHEEFAQRAGRSLDGATAAAGIRATAAATAQASDDELLVAATRRAWWFIRQGVTTLEVKTGYGLTPDAELRLLRLADELRRALPIQIRVTLLAGHTYPEGVDTEDYVIQICDELLPQAIEQKLFDSVEVYCEETAGFSMEDASTILETVYRKKIPTRVAADHLSDSAGGALAPAFYSKAAAHLNFTDDIAVKAMGRAGTTAVLLPGSALELGPAEHRPPVELLRENHIPLAVSTGCNPGTSPLADLRGAAHLACTLFGLSPAEALNGITAAAARALALEDGTGTLVAGGPADLVVWDTDRPSDLVYWFGAPLCAQVWSAGARLDMPG